MKKSFGLLPITLAIADAGVTSLRTSSTVGPSVRSPLGASVEVTLTNCSPPESHASNIKFTYSPNSAVLGEKLSITGTANASIGDESPIYTAKAHYGFVKLINHTDTLCHPTSVDLPLGIGEIVIDGLRDGCPLRPGPVSLMAVLPIAELPGTISAELNAIASTGNTELCVDIAIDVHIEQGGASAVAQ